MTVVHHITVKMASATQKNRCVLQPTQELSRKFIYYQVTEEGRHEWRALSPPYLHTTPPTLHTTNYTAPHPLPYTQHHTSHLTHTTPPHLLPYIQQTTLHLPPYTQHHTSYLKYDSVRPLSSLHLIHVFGITEEWVPVMSAWKVHLALSSSYLQKVREPT